MPSAATADGWLARRDPRAKLGGLIAASLGLTAAGPPGLALGAATALALTRLAAVRPRDVAWRMRAVLPIVVLGTAGRAFTAEGALWSVDGLVAGLVASGRFVLLVALALVVSSSTPPADLALAVEWALEPIPLVAATDWATMFAAAVRFFPLIGEEVAGIRDAQRARLGDARPLVRRLVGLLVGAVAGTLRRADDLALAMRARGYTGERTPRRRLRAGPADAGLFVAGVAWAVAVAML